MDCALNYLFVACSGRIEVLDVNQDGKQLSSLDTGEGVDNIDYSEARHTVYAGAGRAAKLTVASVDSAGMLAQKMSVATVAGARNGVATEDESVYLTDSSEWLFAAVRLGPVGRHQTRLGEGDLSLLLGQRGDVGDGRGDLGPDVLPSVTSTWSWRRTPARVSCAHRLSQNDFPPRNCAMAYARRR